MKKLAALLPVFLACGFDPGVPTTQSSTETTDPTTGPDAAAGIPIVLRGTFTAPSLDDGAAAQTPGMHRLGVHSVTLVREDGSSITLGAPSEVDLASAEGAVIARFPLDENTGRFTRMHVELTHIRYTISATAHAAGGAYAGELTTVQASFTTERS